MVRREAPEDRVVSGADRQPGAIRAAAARQHQGLRQALRGGLGPAGLRRSQRLEPNYIHAMTMEAISISAVTVKCHNYRGHTYTGLWRGRCLDPPVVSRGHPMCGDVEELLVRLANHRTADQLAANAAGHCVHT